MPEPESVTRQCRRGADLKSELASRTSLVLLDSAVRLASREPHVALAGLAARGAAWVSRCWVVAAEARECRAVRIVNVSRLGVD